MIPAPPSFHAGLTDRFAHLLTSPSRTSCDTSLDKLHVLLPCFFQIFIYLDCGEKAGELQYMKFLIGDRSTNVSFVVVVFLFST